MLFDGAVSVVGYVFQNTVGALFNNIVNFVGGFRNKKRNWLNCSDVPGLNVNYVI